MSEKIIFNWMLDLRKKHVNPHERARIIKNYIQETKTSVRQLARDLGIPHTTLTGWLSWNKISPEEYEMLRKRGVTHTEIWTSLKQNKQLEICEEHSEYELEQVLRKIKEIYRNLDSKSPQTIRLINEIQNYLNRILLKIDKELK